MISKAYTELLYDVRWIDDRTFARLPFSDIIEAVPEERSEEQRSDQDERELEACGGVQSAAAGLGGSLGQASTPRGAPTLQAEASGLQGWAPEALCFSVSALPELQAQEVGLHVVELRAAEHRGVPHAPVP